MKRVLVIAYYFPPMGLSGVQRVAKFVKYLPEYGWEPTVLTVHPGGYFAFDDTLLRELEARDLCIERTWSLDPNRLFGRRRQVTLPAEGVRSRLSALSQALFIPDNKVGWYLPAVHAGKRILRNQEFDAIFASAPPYTGLLVASRLKGVSGLPLVVDLRDDWLRNPRHTYPTALHRRAHLQLERKVFRSADQIVTINDVIARAVMDRHPDVRATVIPQGYDPEDFAGPVGPVRSARLRIHYSGTFYDAQTPEPFFRAVAELVQDQPALRDAIELTFAGILPRAYLERAEQLGIAAMIVDHGYLPHDDAVRALRQADVLWMTIGRRAGSEAISTGKLFEYIGSRKPILALIPAGAAREALGGYGASWVAEPNDVPEIRSCLERIVAAWRQEILPEPASDHVLLFDRRVLAGRLAEVFSNIPNHSTATV